MTSLIRRAKYKSEAVDPCSPSCCRASQPALVTVALANKAARVVWAIMVDHAGGIYRRPAGVMHTPLCNGHSQANTNLEVAEDDAM